MELPGVALQLRHRLRRGPPALLEQILPVEEHERIHERRQRADRLVGLGDRLLRAGGDVVPGVVLRGERLVVQVRVQRLEPPRLPEPALLDVHAGVPGVDPSGAGGHLHHELLAALDLRDGLVLHLHPGHGLELWEVFDDLIDPGVLVEQQEELGPLVPPPGDGIGHGRREGQRGGRRPGHRRRAKREGFAAGQRASASIPAVARHRHTAPLLEPPDRPLYMEGAGTPCARRIHSRDPCRARGPTEEGGLR